MLKTPKYGVNEGQKVESYRVEELLDLYRPVKGTIESRLRDFGEIWQNASDEDLFRELAFCLLTPQSRARVCWAAIERMVDKSMLGSCGPEEIRAELTGVRFRKIRRSTMARTINTGSFPVVK